MATFKDRVGREWTLTIDLVEIRRVREATEVQLGAVSEVIKLGKVEWLEKFGDVLWVLVEEQAKSIGTGAVTKEQFLRGMTGDALPDAHDALAKAYLFFCPTALRRAAMEEETKGENAESSSPISSPTDGSSAESVESIPIPAA